MFKIKSFFVVGVILPMILLPGCHPLEWELPRMDPACPCVQSISPAGAGVGDTIRVSGVNFDSESVGRFSLSVGNTIVGIQSISNANELFFVVPEGLENGPVGISRDDCDPEVDACVGQGPLFTYHFRAVSAEIWAGIPGETSVFNSPRGLDVDAEGRVIVADRNNDVIQRIDLNGVPSVLAGAKGEGAFSNDPFGALARFNSPADVVVDPNNQDIYVADETNHSIRIIKPGNNHGVSTLTGKPEDFSGQDGAFNMATFTRPVGLAIDGTGENLYVTEFSRDRLRRLNQSTPTGSVTTILGTPDGSSSPLDAPVGTAFSLNRDPAFSVFVADRGNEKIRSVNPDSKSIADVPPLAGSVLSTPNDIELDDRGNTYVTEHSTKRVYVIYADDTVMAIAGEGINFPFQKPSGIAIDRTENVLYVSDESQHIVVRIELK